MQQLKFTIFPYKLVLFAKEHVGALKHKNGK